MNKITVSTQGGDDSPTLGSIKPGTIFRFTELTSGPWCMKLSSDAYAHLSNGMHFLAEAPSTRRQPVAPLVGSICIEPE